jgi:chromosome segregation ATPase
MEFNTLKGQLEERCKARVERLDSQNKDIGENFGRLRTLEATFAKASQTLDVVTETVSKLHEGFNVINDKVLILDRDWSQFKSSMASIDARLVQIEKQVWKWAGSFAVLAVGATYILKMIGL